MSATVHQIYRDVRRDVVMPSLRDLLPAEAVIPHAYGLLIEGSGDLMDFAMKHANQEEAAVIYHLAQAMAERMLVVKQLAETRLERFQIKEGA